MNGIVERGPYRGVKFPKRQVNPSPGELRLRCGKCGGMDFEVHVKSILSIGQVTAVICIGCLKVRKVDPRAFIEGTGISSNDPKDDYVKPPPSSVRSKVNGQ